MKAQWHVRQTESFREIFCNVNHLCFWVTSHWTRAFHFYEVEIMSAPPHLIFVMSQFRNRLLLKNIFGFYNIIYVFSLLWLSYEKEINKCNFCLIIIILKDTKRVSELQYEKRTKVNKTIVLFIRIIRTIYSSWSIMTVYERQEVLYF